MSWVYINIPYRINLDWNSWLMITIIIIIISSKIMFIKMFWSPFTRLHSLSCSVHSIHYILHTFYKFSSSITICLFKCIMVWNFNQTVTESLLFIELFNRYTHFAVLKQLNSSKKDFFIELIVLLFNVIMLSIVEKNIECFINKIHLA